MKDTLLKIATYIEQQNTRLQLLEQKADIAEKSNEELSSKITLLEKRIEELERHSVANTENEPEVEVELILEEDDDTALLSTTESKEENDLNLGNESAMDQQNQETPMIESIPESTLKSETNTIEGEQKTQAPLQTSLFGVAVTDIRHAISLGDRFLFQRELFGGNGEAMQKALNDLNNCNDIDAAIAYINKLGWNKDSSTYDLFVNILHRRFDH